MYKEKPFLQVNLIWKYLHSLQDEALCLSCTAWLCYRNFHCRYIFSTIPPPDRMACLRLSSVGGTPHSIGTCTVITSRSCRPDGLPRSAWTTCTVVHLIG